MLVPLRQTGEDNQLVRGRYVVRIKVQVQYEVINGGWCDMSADVF